MKKILAILLAGIFLIGCSSSGTSKGQNSVMPTKEVKEFTAENLLLYLKDKNSNLDKIVVYDENTDPNEKLGRPGNYIGKADFSDSRIEQTGEDLIGGTIEVFENSKDCQSRADYLDKFNDSSLGAFGVNAYIYQYDKAVLRVDYKLTPEQAEEYHTQMDEIMTLYK